ncbi:2-phosphosulfolactate phosphatase [Melioribacter sp. Ez-97]|jgi:2-phosphosulfolactate phosphatase|uniref:2-phosphosulfolactate phosphatase n=1 Tax=Melioribacter sp. Ez-97 TaxID=3423434 RepID=UPI003ED9C67A
MKINVLFSNIFLDELYFTGKTVVVIDVLRATTVITTALANGAREVIPVSTLDFAMKISGDAFRSQTLLCGERNTKMVEGFNLGNSPLEYRPEVVAGKSIIFYTTNGSKSIVKAKFSKNLFACSFNNLPAIANHMTRLNEDFEIVCAGTNGMFNLEDAVCAGILINEISKLTDNVELSDSANASVILSTNNTKNLFNFLSATEHGKLLIENGFEDDILECAKIGTTDVIPYYVSGTMKRL